MPESVAELRRELAQLRSSSRALADRVAEIEERVFDHVGDALGAGGQNYSHPRQSVQVAEYGAATHRVDDTGIQIAPPQGTETPAIRWLPRFYLAEDLASYLGPQASIGATLDGNDVQVTVRAASLLNNGLSESQRAQMVLLSNPDGDDLITAGLQVRDGGIGATGEVSVRVVPSTDLFYIFLSHQLGIASVTADPTAAGDGALTYRSDTDRLRLRANGAWVYLVDDAAMQGNTTMNFIDAKGDIAVGSADNTIDNLTVGANYKALFADSAQTLGLGYRPTWYLLDATGTANTFNTTAADTTLYSVSVPANSMGANGVVHMFIMGNYLNNSAAGDTIRIRVKFGGTTWINDITGAIANVAARHPFVIEVWCGNQNATNAQWIALRVFMNFGNATAGIGDIGTAAGQFVGVLASDPTAAPNIDTTAARDLVVSIQHGTSDANIETSRRYAYCEVMTTV